MKIEVEHARGAERTDITADVLPPQPRGTLDPRSLEDAVCNVIYENPDYDRCRVLWDDIEWMVKTGDFTEVDNAGLIQRLAARNDDARGEADR